MARHHHTHDTFYHVYYEKPVVLLDAYGNDFGGRYIVVRAYDEAAAARKARKRYKSKFGKIVKIVEKWKDSGEYKKNPRRKKRARRYARRNRLRSHRRKYSRRRNPSERMWTYKGVDVYPADRNSSGIRWYARTYSGEGVLRADTKDGIRRLIKARGRRKNPRRYSRRRR